MRAPSRLSLAVVTMLGGIAAVAAPTMGSAQDGRKRGAAQKTTASQSARVEGDVYLVMKSGDTKAGAGRTVYLLRDTQGLRDSLTSVCAEYTKLRLSQSDSARVVKQALSDSRAAAFTEMMDDLLNPLKLDAWHAIIDRQKRAPAEDSILEKRTWIRAADAIHAVIARSILDTVGTGMNAHYVFTVTKPGEYIVFSEWEIFDNAYRWWAPINLSPGQLLKRDLDNSAQADLRLFCGVK
jgi:hypothetical protein